MRKVLLTLFLLACVGSLHAQSPRTRVEWGLLGGLNVSSFNSDMQNATIDDKLGWHAGMSMAVKFGVFAVEPQLLYVRQGFSIDYKDQNYDFKSHSIDVPILFSLRILKPFRIYLGPVLTVMNTCDSGIETENLEFTRVRPTLSYTAGLGVVFLRHFLVDFRYNGQFKAKNDVMLPSGDTGSFRTHNMALSIGYIF